MKGITHTRKIQRSKKAIKGITLKFSPMSPKGNKTKYFGSLNISENIIYGIAKEAPLRANGLEKYAQELFVN